MTTRSINCAFVQSFWSVLWYVKGKTLDVLVKTKDKDINIEINTTTNAYLKRRTGLRYHLEIGEKKKQELEDNYFKIFENQSPQS